MRIVAKSPGLLSVQCFATEASRASVRAEAPGSAWADVPGMG